MKNGKIFFNDTLFLLSETFRVCINAKINVIGIIANVRVSFTVTALSNVAFPRFHILSQVAAAAVTEDVSFTAVPANIPKASPPDVSKPINLPKIGKRIDSRL